MKFYLEAHGEAEQVVLKHEDYLDIILAGISDDEDKVEGKVKINCYRENGKLFIHIFHSPSDEIRISSKEI